MILKKLVAIRVTEKRLIRLIFGICPLDSPDKNRFGSVSFTILGSEGLETTHPRPAKTGTAKSEELSGESMGQLGYSILSESSSLGQRVSRGSEATEVRIES